MQTSGFNPETGNEAAVSITRPVAMFTPGPHQVRRAKTPNDGEYDYAIGAEIDGREYCIAEVFGRVGESVRPNAKATATLFAAAADLYAALKLARPFVEYAYQSETGEEEAEALHALEEIDSALAKVESAQ